MSEKCPKCGAEAQVDGEWSCGSYIPRVNGVEQDIWSGNQCLRNQLAAATRRAEIAEEALRLLLEFRCTDCIEPCDAGIGSECVETNQALAYALAEAKIGGKK